MMPLRTSSCDAASSATRLPPAPLRPFRPRRRGGHRPRAGAAPKVAGHPDAAQSGPAAPGPARYHRPPWPSPRPHRPQSESSMPDFFEVVHTQRAARTFLPDDVDDATVARILTAATHAPSAENSQPFVFVVVRDPAARAAIGELTARLWQGGAGELEAGRLSPGFWRDVDRGAMGGVAAGAALVGGGGGTGPAPPPAPGGP